MKRGLVVVVLVLFVSILLLSLVSASWFSDIWNKITGRVVYNADISDCQLCKRYADSNNRANAQWGCVNFSNIALLTDFVGDVDSNDDFDFKVSCSNQEIRTGCQLCRRFNDGCSAGCVHNATWKCVSFNNTFLLTDFTKDVNNNDYFDLKVSCSLPEMQTGCQLCRRWADNNGRANATWGCVNFDGSALNTNFVNNVNSNDDFDFKVSCNLGTAPCVENWKCTDWGSCSNNKQTRTCQDLNNCGTTTSKPDESRSCCSDTCASLGYGCGSQLICGSSTNCGSCQQGYNCQEGNCVQNVTSATCTDSDDGLNYYTKGYLNTSVSPGTKFEDYCLDSNNLIERHCLSSNPNNFTVQYSCPYGCSDGACLSQQNYTEVDGCSYLSNEVIDTIKNLQDSDYTVTLKEGEKVYRNNYVIIPGYALKVTRIYNSSYSYYDDEVEFRDVLSGYDYKSTITSEGSGSVTIGGKTYNIKYKDDRSLADDEYVILDYPQISENDKMVFYNCEIDETCKVNINNKNYVVELVAATDSSATIMVTDESTLITEKKEITEGGSKIINGLEVYVFDADESANRIVANLEVNGMYGMLLETGEECEVEKLATCTDSDGGMEPYIKGTATDNTHSLTDSCFSDGKNLEEAFCVDNKANEINVSCPNVCQDGACIKGVCEDLLAKVKNPTDIATDYGNFESGGSYTYNWTVRFENDELHKVTTYSAGWSAKIWENWYYLGYNVNVFDSGDIENYLNGLLNWQLCRSEKLGSSVVYICSYYEESQNPENTNARIYWVNENKLFEVYTHISGEWNSEILTQVRIYKLVEFTEKLKNNYYDYVYASIPYPIENILRKDLGSCPSELVGVINPYTNETCSSCWNCKIEPVICPEYGRQTRTCVDECCNQEKKEEQIYCSPGICSGCYVPRWLESSDNICIPYGTRFKQIIGTQQQPIEEQEKIELYTNYSGSDYKLEIISQEDATLTLYGKESTPYIYNLTLGQDTDVEIPDWAEEISKLVITTDYIGTDYVDITVTVKGYQSAPFQIKAYCNYDGRIYQQKGDWGECQNNYECESNACSSEECIGIVQMIVNSKSLKARAVKFFCKLFHLISQENYEQCVVDILNG